MDITHKKILTALKNRDLTIKELAEKLSLERHTTAKYLEYLSAKGLIKFSEKGKSKLFTLNENDLGIEKINTDPLINEFKRALLNVTDNVKIHDKEMKVVWSNKASKKDHRCFENHSNSEMCKNCPVHKTLITGKKHESFVEMDNSRKRVIAEPIFDENKKTIAVIEIIKEN